MIRFARPVWLVTAASLALGGVPARAGDELPPERPTTPYRATVRNTYSVSEPGGGRSGGDTVEIRVSGPRLREESKIMEESIFLVDVAERTVIQFDPKAKDKVAVRGPLNDAPIPYIDGRAALAAYDASWAPARFAGRAKVAKRDCTVLHIGKPEADGVTACVSKEGVVLRAKIVWPDYEREFEVLDFDPGDQDAKWFAPPEGFTVVEDREDASPSE